MSRSYVRSLAAPIPLKFARNFYLLTFFGEVVQRVERAGHLQTFTH